MILLLVIIAMEMIVMEMNIKIKDAFLAKEI